MSTPYEDLLQKRAEIEREVAEVDRQLREAQIAHRQEGISKLKVIITEYELGIADVTSAFSKVAIRGSKGPAGGRSGTKVEPKFRNSATGETWSGRGLQPTWLKNALASGKSLDEFKIAQ